MHFFSKSINEFLSAIIVAITSSVVTAFICYGLWISPQAKTFDDGYLYSFNCYDNNEINCAIKLDSNKTPETWSIMGTLGPDENYYNYLIQIDSGIRGENNTSVINAYVFHHEKPLGFRYILREYDGSIDKQRIYLYEDKGYELIKIPILNK